MSIVSSFPIRGTPCKHSSTKGHAIDRHERTSSTALEERQLNQLRLATGIAGTILQAAAMATRADLIATRYTTTNVTTTHATDSNPTQQLHPPFFNNTTIVDDLTDAAKQAMTDRRLRHEGSVTGGQSIAKSFASELGTSSEAQSPACLVPKYNTSKAVSFYAPTDYKERQKQLAQQRKDTDDQTTKTKTKRRKPHEIHHDDCGEKLDGLGNDVHFADGYSDDDEDTLDEFVDNIHYTNFSQHWFIGSNVNLAMRDHGDMLLFNSMCALEVYHGQLDKHGVSVCEIAGGTARCSRVLVKHRVACGRNFDLVTGTDMTLHTEQEAFMRYRKASRVQVVIMAPICGPFGGWSYMNRQIHPQSWKQRLDYALKLGSFCGRVALAQYDDGRDWLNEQPTNSDLYDYEPWPRVRQHPRTVIGRFHQCQTGARTQDGQHINKSTDLWASDYDLIYYLDGLVCGSLPDICNGTHVHLHGEDAAAAQVWPWDMARRIAWGVLRLLSRRRWQTGYYFPGADDNPAQRCPGCRRRRPRDHEEHSRIQGECRVWDTPTVVYPCPGCKANAPRSDPRHTRSVDPAQRCRVTMMRQERNEAGRVRPIAGARPPTHQRQDPRVEPPAPAPPQEEGEREPADSGDARGSDEPARDAVPAEFDDNDDEPRDDAGPIVAPVPGLGSEAQSPASRSPREAQSPAEERPGEPRLRHGHDVRSRDQRQPLQPHGDEDDDRWGPSDFKTCIRLLNDKNEAVVRKTLRRLHLRWYHATIAQMQRLLSLVGAPASAMRLIPEIVDTCRICRTWTRSAPNVRTTVRLSTRFNQTIQADLMFYADETGQTPQDYIILHLVDECIRWTVAEELAGKDHNTILEAVTCRWIQQYGAPEMMIWDGETSISSDEAKIWADRWNIELVIRPKDKKAWIAERHHEILRTQLHKTQSQLAADRIRVPFKATLAESVLAKNALLSTGHGTPYVSLYGRVPRLLPQIEDITGDARQQDEWGSEGLRHIHRLREVSVASAVTAMAEYRIKMAEKSRTPLAGEQLRLSNGDQVEIFRKQATKDRPGWIGPASVTDCTELSHGKVTVRWQGRHITVPLESVRRAMIYLVWLTEAVYGTMLDGPPTNALSYLLDFVEGLRSRAVVLGWIRPDSTQGWRFSADTAKHRDVYHALLHVATNHLHLDGCIAGKCAHRSQRLAKLTPGALGSVLMYWYADNRDDMCYAQFTSDSAIDVA